MGMPKWECPAVSQVKIKMGPNWDQHGNAQVGVPKCVPSVLPTWDQCGQPHFQFETWDPLGSEVGSSWKIVRGSQLGPTCITHGQTYLGPMWAPRTKRSGSHLGCPSGTHLAAHLGPKWGPCGIPVGVGTGQTLWGGGGLQNVCGGGGGSISTPTKRRGAKKG